MFHLISTLYLLSTGLSTMEVNTAIKKNEIAHTIQQEEITAYSFTSSYKMGMETFDKKGNLENEFEITIYVNEEEDIMAMETPASENAGLMIYDFGNKEMVTLIDAQGMKMGMRMNIEEPKEEVEAESGEYKFTKTGNTETISGYVCEEYKVEGPEMDAKSENFMWVSPETEMGWIEAISKMNQANPKKQAVRVPHDYPEGAVIRMVYKSLKSDEKTIITVKEIDENSDFSISTDDYRFMNFSGK